MLCDHLEGWDREGGREGDARGKRYGDICICITDSLCYKAETGFPGGTVVENLPANAGDTGSSPGLGRSHMPRSN